LDESSPPFELQASIGKAVRATNARRDRVFEIRNRMRGTLTEVMRGKKLRKRQTRFAEHAFFVAKRIERPFTF
jgi:hypothetical protein